MKQRTQSAYLALLTFGQILASFGMQWYVVMHFGAGSDADAFYAGGTLALIVKLLLIDTFGAVLVPVLSAMTGNEVRAQGWTVLGTMTGLFLAFSIVLHVISPAVMPLLVPGFSASAARLSVELSVIQCYGLAGMAGTAALSAVYQVNGRFIAPPLSILVSGVISFALLAWKLPAYGIAFAAWMQVAAVSLPVFALLPGLGFVRPRWDPEVLRKVWRLARPVVAGKAYYMTNAPIDRILASFLGPGSVVIFTLTGRFYDSVMRILTQSVLTPFTPELARLAQKNDWTRFRELNKRQSITILVLGSAIVAGVCLVALGWLLAVPAQPVRPVAGRMNSVDAARICFVLLLMAGIVPCTGFANALTNAFYAQSDTRTPTKAGVIGYTVGIACKALGAYVGALSGLAIAVTLWSIGFCIAFELLLRRSLAANTGRQSDAGVHKIAIASASTESC